MTDRMSHINESGEALMVDVSGKPVSVRTAVAEGRLKMSAEAFSTLIGQTSAKGDVLAVARVAGIMAVKRTAELIPLCHALPLETATIDFSTVDGAVTATCRVKTSAKTGVEMEALTGVSVALLTIYDMLKAVDRAMTIDTIALVSKTGGQRGDYAR